MQYILQDLIKLSMADRLSIVERIICSFQQTGREQELFDLLREKLDYPQAQRTKN